MQADVCSHVDENISLAQHVLQKQPKSTLHITILDQAKCKQVVAFIAGEITKFSPDDPARSLSKNHSRTIAQGLQIRLNQCPPLNRARYFDPALIDGNTCQIQLYMRGSDELGDSNTGVCQRCDLPGKRGTFTSQRPYFVSAGLQQSDHLLALDSRCCRDLQLHVRKTQHYRHLLLKCDQAARYTAHPTKQPHQGVLVE
ncbi:hypothetical protein XACM_3498 [Xanthomonas euvesicatoria pv. citrumelo F1]|nr:hypothetical protein XACM_3498 [Xanthomonas euvesicatoria pv. citrumelo F1]